MASSAPLFSYQHTTPILGNRGNNSQLSSSYSSNPCSPSPNSSYPNFSYRCPGHICNFITFSGENSIFEFFFLNWGMVGRIGREWIHRYLGFFNYWIVTDRYRLFFWFVMDLWLILLCSWLDYGKRQLLSFEPSGFWVVINYQLNLTC